MTHLQDRIAQANWEAEQAKREEDDRRAFIRQAAIALACAMDRGPAWHDSTGHSGFALKADEVWKMAEELWAAKPAGV